ncbi:hypothetical protein [Microbacterium sp. Marseille-Q6965]|uniref:PH-like domain-containing protein n=1 Tax=Microbacterium sp. Marseille-Q6965 TaxID=2965072 RepID=UPI0021B7568C|nr:hypothetical protein [Microbacterium sp. Marseille-Q6965]
MIEYVPGVALILAIVILALSGMWWGWRRRSRAAAALGVPFGPASGKPVATFGGLYVATTVHDEPLQRLALPHLGFRARVSATVTTAGLALDMPGAPTVFLAAARLVGAGRATWTIDRVVERDGLVLIAWTTDDGTVVDSYFRLQSSDPDALVAAVEELRTTTTGASL